MYSAWTTKQGNTFDVGKSCAFLLPVWSIADACKAITWLFAVIFREWESEQQKALLDLRCILWTLRTSLDEPVRLSALNYLAATTLTEFDPIFVVDCFNILFDCVKVIDGKAVTAQGMEQLAQASSTWCPKTLSHLMAVDPTSRVLEDVRRRYAGTVLPLIYLDGLPFQIPTLCTQSTRCLIQTSPLGAGGKPNGKSDGRLRTIQQ